ncbi:hypothetical protein K3495_g6297 [Podosphaera aphanis]|nr:hypothetical protein K3495_g6297 [Podosphaera aphanis]
MAPQDSFIDEDEDYCPLCVEEFDLSDKNFRPCPCGYQICQFCFNNIKNNINGLCPACRRPYDEKTIEWKVVTPEEIAQFKANVQKNARKKQEQRQKEEQKREVESLNRKHLSGLRVIQKNLVYVVGISPGIPEQEILSTLRGEKYFGQYGKIVKIVVSNKKQGDNGPNGQSLGVYVTFARKEDAARCIAAVNGSQNGDRVLRAQLGTTKYCSTYLRNETCTNKNCMFLHEPGDNDDSYSRQDLSSINSVSSQRPLHAISLSGASSRQNTSGQNTHPTTSSIQSMARDGSKEGSDNGEGSENGQGSALPSSASWANRGLSQRSRRGSRSTSGAASSPAASQALPVVARPSEKQHDVAQPSKIEQSGSSPSENRFPSKDDAAQDTGVLVNLLKAINNPALSFPPPSTESQDKELYDRYPPLFDVRGGEKRRAMKEFQEEARLQFNQVSQDKPLVSVPETLDEIEPESGSLQLGGEPEDQETGHDENLSNFHNVRQSSSQLPIQRVGNNNSLNSRLVQTYPQNLNNLSSINGRTLTPLQQQQLLLMKPGQQSEFVEQFPPGVGGNQIGRNSNLFQQGHGRQASRYNFSNDKSTSTSLKNSANSKLMAQQLSMMPPTNHSQQSTSYPPSIQGPPPGLKSSSTPPANGSIFGQNLGYTNTMSASLFSGLEKGNNGEMLRDMIRGRGAVGGNQVHDTSKREYMFPSFLHQYPSTSTPAPAPGMASLYGPQTGAFHDFGQKQKKKGKKHRHANTSSSGGSALVDLADPSILQARMQHQQQSNAGVGQDQNLPSLDDARSSVDALVGESSTENYRQLQSFDTFAHLSRSSTPLAPPGFGLPHAHPHATPREEIVTRPTHRITSTSATFTTKKTLSSIGTSNAQKAVSTALPEAPCVETTTAPTKVTTDPSPTAPSTSDITQTKLHSEDFPALESAKKNIPTSLVSKVITPASLAITVKKLASKPEESQNTSTLSISVTPKNNIKLSVTSEVPKQSTTFPPLPTSTTSTQSPLSRSITKTLRLSSTSKNEVSSGGNGTPSSMGSVLPSKSRQPGINASGRLERPGSPTSEIISDNASITSTSFSRASSPPPTRVGSAPIRATTKSSQKKQRLAQKEKNRAEIEAAAVVATEVEIAPIIGRKKKQKKGRISSASGAPTPIPSRLNTSLSLPKLDDQIKNDQVIDNKPEVATKQTKAETDAQKNLNKSTDSKADAKSKDKVTRTSEPKTDCPEVEIEPVEKPPPTAAAVFQELVASGVIKDVNELFLLKNISSSNRHLDIPDKLDNIEISPKLAITPEDHDLLLAGKTVHKSSEGGYRIMLTPNGDCVRNLTEEEEKKYLDYQERLAKDFGPTTFVSTKHSGQNGFTMIGGRAVPSGPPTFFPVPNKGTPSLDPVSKIQRDEALNYINQYVLPTLSSNTQLDRTLNANTIQGEMMRSGSVDATWKTWSPEQVSTTSETGDFYMSPSPSNEGMMNNIATHFPIGDMGRQGSGSLLSLADAESAMQIARKEVEGFEKRLNTLIKRNRRLLLGAGH